MILLLVLSSCVFFMNPRKNWKDIETINNQWVGTFVIYFKFCFWNILSQVLYIQFFKCLPIQNKNYGWFCHITNDIVDESIRNVIQNIENIGPTFKGTQLLSFNSMYGGDQGSNAILQLTA